MYERMLNKNKEPSLIEIKEYLNEENYCRLIKLENTLKNNMI